MPYQNFSYRGANLTAFKPVYMGGVNLDVIDKVGTALTNTYWENYNAYQQSKSALANMPVSSEPDDIALHESLVSDFNNQIESYSQGGNWQRADVKKGVIDTVNNTIADRRTKYLTTQATLRKNVADLNAKSGWDNTSIAFQDALNNMTYVKPTDNGKIIEGGWNGQALPEYRSAVNVLKEVTAIIGKFHADELTEGGFIEGETITIKDADGNEKQVINPFGKTTTDSKGQTFPEFYAEQTVKHGGISKQAISDWVTSVLMSDPKYKQSLAAAARLNLAQALADPNNPFTKDKKINYNPSLADANGNIKEEAKFKLLTNVAPGLGYNFITALEAAGIKGKELMTPGADGDAYRKEIFAKRGVANIDELAVQLLNDDDNKLKYLQGIDKLKDATSTDIAGYYQSAYKLSEISNISNRTGGLIGYSDNSSIIKTIKSPGFEAAEDQFNTLLKEATKNTGTSSSTSSGTKLPSGTGEVRVETGPTFKDTSGYDLTQVANQKTTAEKALRENETEATMLNNYKTMVSGGVRDDLDVVANELGINSEKYTKDEKGDALLKSDLDKIVEARLTFNKTKQAGAKIDIDNAEDKAIRLRDLVKNNQENTFVPLIIKSSEGQVGIVADNAKEWGDQDFRKAAYGLANYHNEGKDTYRYWYSAPGERNISGIHVNPRWKETTDNTARPSNMDDSYFGIGNEGSPTYRLIPSRFDENGIAWVDMFLHDGIKQGKTFDQALTDKPDLKNYLENNKEALDGLKNFYTKKQSEYMQKFGETLDAKQKGIGSRVTNSVLLVADIPAVTNYLNSLPDQISSENGFPDARILDATGYLQGETGLVNGSKKLRSLPGLVWQGKPGTVSDKKDLNKPMFTSFDILDAPEGAAGLNPGEMMLQVTTRNANGERLGGAVIAVPMKDDKMLDVMTSIIQSPAKDESTKRAKNVAMNYIGRMESLVAPISSHVTKNSAANFANVNTLGRLTAEMKKSQIGDSYKGQFLNTSRGTQIQYQIEITNNGDAGTDKFDVKFRITNNGEVVDKLIPSDVVTPETWERLRKGKYQSIEQLNADIINYFGTGAYTNVSQNDAKAMLQHVIELNYKH